MTEPHLEILGRYKILRVIGRGAMGIVYEAIDPDIDRVVAIKTINLMLSPEEMAQYEARFKQEIKAAGRLNHPNIVTIYDVGKTDNMAYMAMEFISGCELKDLLKEGHALPVEVALDIVAQAAEGLAFAHSRDIIHRDVKPANIMLLENEDGIVAKITDFGIARMPASAVKTMTGMVMGSPRYMSPEQVVGKHLSARSDIFSLGVVLYEALTGVAPFESDTISSIMYQTVHVAQQPPSSLNPQLGPELDALIAKALAKSPDDRIESMKAFSRGLREILRARTGTAGLATSANFQLNQSRMASSTIPPQNDAAPIATATAPLPVPPVTTAPPLSPPQTAPASTTQPPPATRDDFTRMIQRPASAAIEPPPALGSVTRPPAAPAPIVPPAVTSPPRSGPAHEESERTVWPVAVANQFDSTVATLRLAEITAQTEELKEFISASRQMPAFKEPVKAAAKNIPPVQAATEQMPQGQPGISLDRTQMMPIERKLPMGPLLLLGSLSATVLVLLVALLMSFS
jgi:eukaryotic-like serine/threonine-protein kinase